MEPDSGSKPVLPTQAMDDLFVLHVKNFLEAKQSHLKVLAKEVEASLPMIEKWSRGKYLPPLAVRPAIMDWIWNHNCDCKCP